MVPLLATFSPLYNWLFTGYSHLWSAPAGYAGIKPTRTHTHTQTQINTHTPLSVHYQLFSRGTLVTTGSSCLCNCWPMLSACLSNQASSELILTPSRRPPSLTMMAPSLGDNPLWILSSRDSDTLTCITQSHKMLLSIEKGRQSEDYSQLCINYKLFLMKGR